MNHARFGPCAAAAGFSVGVRSSVPAQAQPSSSDPSEQDIAFIALQNAYRPHAGLMRLQRLDDGGRRSPPEWQDCDVEHLVHGGDVFAFPWYDALWIPMFQFALPGHAVAKAPQRIVAELGRGFDGWALASWFVAPNSWLASHSPIECLDSGLPQVLEAARADRFVMTG